MTASQKKSKSTKKVPETVKKSASHAKEKIMELFKTEIHLITYPNIINQKRL